MEDFLNQESDMDDSFEDDDDLASITVDQLLKEDHPAEEVK